MNRWQRARCRIRTVTDAGWRWALGPKPFTPETADGQKHWDETAEALARVEDDEQWR